MFGATKRINGEEAAKAIADHIKKKTRLQEKTDALEKILKLTHPNQVYSPEYDAELWLVKIHGIAKLALGNPDA